MYNFHLTLQLGVLLVYLFNGIALVIYIDALNSYVESEDYIFSSLAPSSLPKGFQELRVPLLFFLLFLVLEGENYASAWELACPPDGILPSNRFICFSNPISLYLTFLTSYPYSTLDKGLLVAPLWH